jgi:hypothetical protein
MGIARTFGSHGFHVGLIARTKDRLDGLVCELAERGVTAAAFPPTSMIVVRWPRPSPWPGTRWGQLMC